MRSLRVQLSLIFSDEDLFDNFVEPLRDNKELSGMIIKLLSAYYYDENVQCAVDGVSIEDVVKDADKVMDSTEAMDKINAMRQTLAMQDYLFEQAKQTLDDGATEMDALMKVNDIVKTSGVVKTESDDVGERVIEISMDKSTSFDENKDSKNTNDDSDLEARVKRIEKAVSDLTNLINSVKFTQSSNTSDELSFKDESKDAEKTEVKFDDSKVSHSESNITEDFSSSDDTESYDSAITETVHEEVEDDASDALSGVLADLLG